MAIPKQVEEQEKQAEELLKQMAQQLEEGNIPDESNSQALPHDSSEPNLMEQSESFEQKQEPDSWEHKYHVLQGKYNAEVPLLHNQIKSLTAQVEALTEQLKSLQNANTDTESSRSQESSMTNIEEFAEQYPEIYDAIVSIVESKFASTIKKLETELAEAKSKAEHASEVSNKMALVEFYQKLDQLVPDWKKINEDPKFAEWLQGVDPLSGYKKYDLIMSHFNRGDAQKVAMFFNLYKKESGVKGKSDFITVPPASTKGGSSYSKPAYTIDHVKLLEAQIRDALSRRDYKKADELEKKLDEILSNLKT